MKIIIRPEDVRRPRKVPPLRQAHGQVVSPVVTRIERPRKGAGSYTRKGRKSAMDGSALSAA